jgi:hypothetical protein
MKRRCSTEPISQIRPAHCADSFADCSDDGEIMGDGTQGNQELVGVASIA